MRSLDQLRDKLDSVKRSLKKAHDEERAHAMGTGGGPAKKATELTPNMMQLAAILSLSIEGLKPRPGDDDYEVDTLETDNESMALEQETQMSQIEIDYDMLSDTQMEVFGAINYTETPSQVIVMDNNGQLIETIRTVSDESIGSKSQSTAATNDCAAMTTNAKKATETKASKPKEKSKWSSYTPAQLRTKVTPALKRRLLSTSKAIDSATRADLYKKDGEMAEAKQKIVLRNLNADDNRSFTRHSIEIANMRLKALREKKMHLSKMKSLKEERKQRKISHELHLRQMQELHAQRLCHAEEFHQKQMQSN